jgi:hypothetical protein
MPDYFQSNNPWLGAAQAGRGLGDTIQDALLQVPKARADARMMQQQFLMNQLEMQQKQQLAPFQANLLQSEAGADTARGKASMSEAGMYDSEAALNRAKQGQLTQQDQLHVKLGQDMGNFVKEALTTGTVSPESAQSLAQSLATIDKVDPNLMPSIMQEVGMSASGMGTNPGLAASAATGAKVPLRMNVPAGATSVNTMNPQAQPFTAPGRSVNDDAETTRLFTSIYQAHPEMTPAEVMKQVKDIQDKGAYGQMQNAPPPSLDPSQGGAPTNTPTPGQIEDGFRFKGGNPADPNSWEKVQ